MMERSGPNEGIRVDALVHGGVFDSNPFKFGNSFDHHLNTGGHPFVGVLSF
jgi:hypothetical protein